MQCKHATSGLLWKIKIFLTCLLPRQATKAVQDKNNNNNKIIIFRGLNWKDTDKDSLLSIFILGRFL